MNLNLILENHWPYCAKATHIITDNKAQNEQMHFLVAKLIVLIISSCTAGDFSENSQRNLIVGHSFRALISDLIRKPRDSSSNICNRIFFFRKYD